jgi:hypothetical protein
VLLPAGLLLAGLPGREQPRRWWPALTMLGCFALVSVALTRDWLSINTVHWRLANRAVTKIDPWDLEGGLSWDGWHTPSPRPKEQPATGSYQFERLREWFPQIRAEYIIAYSAYEDTVVVDREPYSLWLPPAHGELLLLRQPPLRDVLRKPPGGGVRTASMAADEVVPWPLFFEEWLWALPFKTPGLQSLIALSVLGLFLGASGAFMSLCRRAGLSRGRSRWLFLLLVCNPLLLGTQATLLADVAALSLGLIALALYMQAFAGKRPVSLVTASIAATVGTLICLNVIAVPLAVICLFSRKGCRLRAEPAWWLATLLPLLLGIVGRAPSADWQGLKALVPGFASPVEILLLPYWATQFCGLAVLPALALTPPRRWKPLAAALALMAGAAVCWFYSPARTANPHLYDFWLTLLPERIAAVPSADIAVWAITLVGCLAGGALLARCWQHLGDSANAPLLVYGAFQVALLIISPFTFYRVFLFLLPPAVFVAGWPESLTQPVRTIVRERSAASHHRDTKSAAPLTS